MAVERKPLYSTRAWDVVRGVTVQVIGLSGFAVFIEGIREIHTPTAMIVGGGLVVFWTILKVRQS